MKICSHKTERSFNENPTLLEAGLQKGEKGQKEKFLANIDL
jgi:hypothetical protein